MKYAIFALLVLTIFFAACLPAATGKGKPEAREPATIARVETKSAVFAGGCFWCTESDFEKVPGVIDAVSGYTGGRLVDPSYGAVSSGGTGHVEAVKVIYDPTRLDYAKLLEVFWRHVDPTDIGGQFVDRGAQYRSAIFYADKEEHRLAFSSRQQLTASGRFEKPIVTDILPLGPFYTAEAYHQDYYKKNPLRYRYYRSGSGRDRFLKEAWAAAAPIEFVGTGQVEGAAAMERPAQMGEENVPRNDMDPVGMAAWSGDQPYRAPDPQTLRRQLTALQYKVTQEDHTEPPFDNPYWDNHRQGIYVDVVSGEPLFSSVDKFDSGTGWPSFTRPLEEGNIVEKADHGFFMSRTEVRSKHADSHLGHLFTDGPQPGGLRYCINSASLRFIPREELQQEGYGRYGSFFN